MNAEYTARTYEDLRAKIADLRPAGADRRRSLVWCSDAELLAASRGVQGELEIFIVGEQLRSDSNLVQEVLSHDTWKRTDGSTITASRLVLPPADPFDAVTTFLCVELLRNGADSDAQEALRLSEPIIETVLQRLHAHTESLIGLIGELLVILQLVRAAPQELHAVLKAWYGSTRSSRDLQLGGVGIEVKTTRRHTSTHNVQGVHQVELGHAVGGVDERFLYLVSVGLEPADSGVGHTLPSLVDAVLDEIDSHVDVEADTLRSAFLSDVVAYGLAGGAHYEHTEMKDRSLYAQGWSVAFCRTYDMTDAGVLVLRSEDILHRTMVELDTLTFRIALPEQVSGDANPSVGLPAMAARILAARGRA